MSDWNLVSPNITDSSGNPVPTASVAVNGMALPTYNQVAAGQGAPTPTSTNSFYALQTASTDYQVSAPGYSTATSSIPPGQTGPVTVDVSLASQTITTGSLTVQTNNPNLNGGNVSVNGNGVETTTTLTNGQATIPDLPAGTYSAMLNVDGYEDIAEPVTVSGSNSTWQPTLVSTNAGASGQPAKAPIPSGAGSSTVPLPSPPASDPYEGIYNNTSFNGYYTSAQCRVYIGNMFVDELASIQFAFQTNVVPVYNYAQSLVADWGEGKGLVQGQLVLNFVSDLYLYTALTEFKNKMGLPAVATANNLDASQLSSLLTARANGASGANIDQAISTLLRNPNAVKQAKQSRNQSRNFSPYSVNACVYPGTFNLTVEIGTGTQPRITRLLEFVKFISNEQIFDQSGNLIGDSYGFMARQLK
jgi:hypothetical protein